MGKKSQQPGLKESGYRSGGTSLPCFWPVYLECLRAIFPDDVFSQYQELLFKDRAVGFRVNTLKSSVKSLEAELRAAGIVFSKVAWLPEGFFAPAAMRDRLVESPAFAEGRLYIQDLSSMLAVHVLDPQPGEEILDIAAAPGGKTCQIAARMQNQGRIAAVEPIAKRMYKLVANMQRANVTIAKTYLMDGRLVEQKTPDRFDRVLLDAPCSGEARFDVRDPTTWQTWSLRKIAECAHKQRGLLAAAVRAARPGGVVLYCTCSFAPEENESIVDSVVSEYEGVVEVAEITLPISNAMPGLAGWDGKTFHPTVRNAVRILPSEEMDGFFLCLLRKTEPTAKLRRRRR